MPIWVRHSYETEDDHTNSALGWVLPANTLGLINEDIGPSNNLNWTATTWTLGSSLGFLLVGRLSDIFGRKWIIIACQVLGTVGMIVGGTANSINTLVGANLLNGIAAAGQLSFGITVGELVSNKMRGPAISLVFLSSLPFAVFGPSIARAFILHTAAGWRWSYYMGIIISGISLILYQVFYHPPTYKQLHVGGKTTWQQFKELDFGGIVLFCGGTVVFLIGLSWGGQAYPWKSAHVIGTLVVGGLTLVAFALYGTITVHDFPTGFANNEQRHLYSKAKLLCQLACSRTSNSSPSLSSPWLVLWSTTA